MIVDTSALVAVVRREDGYEPILRAMLAETGFIPAPVLVEFHRVTGLAGNAVDPDAEALVDKITAASVEIAPFAPAAAMAACRANALFGSGGGRGGKLNMLDLMVYGVAKVSARPILCTGKEFRATDALIHPASRGR